MLRSRNICRKCLFDEAMRLESLPGDLSGACAVGLALSSDQLARLDAASAVPLGFPIDFLAAAMQNVRLAGGHPEKIDKPISPAD